MIPSNLRNILFYYLQYLQSSYKKITSEKYMKQIMHFMLSVVRAIWLGYKRLVMRLIPCTSCIVEWNQSLNRNNSLTDLSSLPLCDIKPWLTSQGGAHLKMGYGYMPPLRAPFHILSRFVSPSSSFICLASQMIEKFAFQSFKLGKKFSA